MTKKYIEQLYNFTEKLMPLLESEIDLLQGDVGEGAIDVKRNVTETLSKLTGLLMQLNKLRKEEEPEDLVSISVDDQKIIERFLGKQ